MDEDVYCGIKRDYSKKKYPGGSYTMQEIKALAEGCGVDTRTGGATKKGKGSRSRSRSRSKRSHAKGKSQLCAAVRACNRGHCQGEKGGGYPAWGSSMDNGILGPAVGRTYGSDFIGPLGQYNQRLVDTYGDSTGPVGRVYGSDFIGPLGSANQRLPSTPTIMQNMGTQTPSVLAAWNNGMGSQAAIPVTPEYTGGRIDTSGLSYNGYSSNAI